MAAGGNTAISGPPERAGDGVAPDLERVPISKDEWGRENTTRIARLPKFHAVLLRHDESRG